MLMIESKTHAKYVEFLDRQFDTLFSTRKANDIANLSLYITECICRGQEMYLNNTKNISKQDIINFDYEISEFADKMFVFIEDFLQKALSSKRKSGDIGFETLAELLDAKNKMLYITARWHTLRYMQVFDLTREPKKQKVPRRLPLLVEPCFCFDRVISTAMGIYHIDGFNPNRGVNCLPPSGGKTYTANAYSNILLMLFWLRFGETGLIRMTNNATNAQAYGEQCSKMLESPENIKIFPELNKYINSNGVLSIFKNKSVERLLLKDCNPECTDSIFMFGADAGINGKRSQLGAILDDLSNGVDDMDNDELHKKITDKVMSDVMDRSDDDDCPIIVQGTMYNQNDTQNKFIEMWLEKGLKKLSGYNFIQVTSDGKRFVCLVDIEDDNGNSIAPELYTNEKLQEKKNYYESRGKGYVYNLIYRQKRDSREPKTFALEYLYQYNWSQRSNGVGDYAYCMIDTTRKSGSDFFAMPIFRRVNKNGRYRLYDVIFKQKSLGIVYDEKNVFAKEICSKIAKENVVQCCVENNTSNTTSALLKSICNSFGYKSCKFRDRFTARKGKNSSKVVRILNMEETIKEYIEFPNPTTLPPNHQLRLFMQHICNWSSTDGQKKTNPDDAIDSVSMFCEEFIYKNAKKGTIKFIDKNFRNFL